MDSDNPYPENPCSPNYKAPYHSLTVNDQIALPIMRDVATPNKSAQPALNRYSDAELAADLEAPLIKYMGYDIASEDVLDFDASGNAAPAPAPQRTTDGRTSPALHEGSPGVSL